jgi:hypothetical protein
MAEVPDLVETDALSAAISDGSGRAGAGRVLGQVRALVVNSHRQRRTGVRAAVCTARGAAGRTGRLQGQKEPLPTVQGFGVPGAGSGDRGL